MNYYIQGDAAKAEQIKAAFEKLGIDVLDFGFADKTVMYCSIGGCVQSLPYSINLMHILYSHPDYKELPVQSKFKVGDWIACDADSFTLSIKSVRDMNYYFHQGASLPIKDIDEHYHLWSIADAKDGDVLVTEDYIFIFKYILHGGVHLYCHYNIDDEEFDSDIPDAIIGNIHDKGAHFRPATKEQRDLLFAKIKEAGYQWNADKKELRKIIKPKFKVGDNIKTGSTIETIAEVGHATRSYYCESGRTISFENQDLWHLTPNPHYDIKNFHVGMPVLVRADNNCRWDYSVFSRITGNESWQFAVCNGVSFTQCIPFEGNEHLLGTTDQCDEQYINW